MKNRTFILLAANLILVFYIFFNLNEDEFENINFKSHIIETISELKLLRHNFPEQKKYYTFHENDLNEWYLKDPIIWPADPLVISNFLTSISHLDAKFLIFTSELSTQLSTLGSFVVIIKLRFGYWWQPLNITL